jgi:hypothetical protein
MEKKNMTPEDIFIYDHSLECNNEKCALCKAIYFSFFATPQEKATERYQKTERYKQYRKKYYYDKIMSGAENALHNMIESIEIYGDEPELSYLIYTLHQCQTTKEIRQFMKDLGIENWEY